ncbi:MAG: PAS domain-containing sensor histidine kinase [Rhodospirillaceae bacterium]|nr:MAG: PAS domain-containing sensor histidine kinase [Rhodospirillaceae bacterium]
MSSAASNNTPGVTPPGAAHDVAPFRAFGHSLRNWTLRLGVWARRVHLANYLALALSGGAIICGIATYLSLTKLDAAGPSPRSVLVLLNVDLLLLLGLVVLVARRLVRLWAAHRAGARGSKLHARLALLFGVVAITPAIIMAVFSALFFTFGVQSWFSERVSSALNESDAVAKAYLVEHKQAIKGDVLAFATDLNRQWPQLSQAPQLLNSFLSTQVAIRGLNSAVIFTSGGDVIAKAGYTFDLQSGEHIPPQVMAQADLGEPAVNTGESGDIVRALVRLDSYTAAYLYVGRFVDPKVLGHVARSEAAVSEYRRLEGSRSNLEIKFTLLFSVVALLLLMVSIWFGLMLATSLARPIIDLIEAAERVGAGDLNVRVKETAASDEISYLGRAFNRMTKRLREQQTELRETNAQLDERRRFTETVLDGVSAGVIGLDSDGNMTLPNRSASILLGTELTAFIGQPVTAFAQEFVEMFNEMRTNPDVPIVPREIQITRGNTVKTLMLQLSAERESGRVVGYVFTFDDITALQSAQRKAAWADVARRIAHEIKNPLTPIQLSAERLKRKYRDRLGEEDSGLFAQCTDTIIRHVGDIGQMVDEFSAFARMPAPVLKEIDLTAIVRDAVALQRAAFPRVSFAMDTPGTPVMIRGDARQIGQAVTNVVKNALEAIEARVGTAGGGRIGIKIAVGGRGVVVSITDNGIGLPQGERARLTEPYVTSRAKGTGLGLAIVKKVLEDHGGVVVLEDAPQTAEDPQGACVSLEFPSGLLVRPAPIQLAAV